HCIAECARVADTPLRTTRPKIGCDGPRRRRPRWAPCHPGHRRSRRAARHPGGPRRRPRSRGLLELLSTAVSDGRLTLEEYSARADRALAARALDELATLTADLQRPADRPVDAPERLTAILGNESRKGYWRVPSHLVARSVLGDCHIELEDAVLTSHVTTIEANATLGAVTIFVPDGVEVRLTGTAVLGAKSSQLNGAPLPGAPVINVHAPCPAGGRSPLDPNGSSGDRSAGVPAARSRPDAAPAPSRRERA
ncbi:MAG: DUF1707 domain-containing protein, partial [Solirubrobacteraceae bacterium]